MTKQHWKQGGIEPEVEELLTDPIVALVLRRDRITLDDVWDAIRAAGAAGREPPPAVRRQSPVAEPRPA